MNNPPDVSQDPKRTRGIRARRPKARQRLSDGGRALARVHRGHRRAFLRRFRCTDKANIAVAMLVATFKAGASCRDFHASRCGKTAHLPHPDFHRLFCARTFLAYITGVVRLSGLSLDVA